jgi:nicotinate dehydrogenase subunit B
MNAVGGATGGKVLSTSLAASPRLGDWLEFAADTVFVRTGKVELGQGIRTALAQIVADELDVELVRIQVASATTSLAPDEGFTSGSLSVQHSGAALRQVCAEARLLASGAAATMLGVADSELSLANGRFAAATGEVDYWNLPMAELLDRHATGTALPKDPGDLRLVGTSIRRTDLLGKLTGSARYITDLRLPGQVFARVVRPPGRSSTLVALDTTPARALPDVVDVIVEGSFIAVVAEREEVALAAARLLTDSARWQVTETLPDESDLATFLTGATAESQVLLAKGEQTEGAHGEASYTATYSRPFLAHGSIAASSAVARWHDGLLEVWTHSQGIFPLRAGLAEALNLPESSITVTHVDGAGCYGHNAADDAAYDAALLAIRLPDRPVQVVWSRADELRWSPLGPAMRVQLSADLDPSGHIRSWRHEVWSNGHTSRPGAGRETPAFSSYSLQNRVPLPVASDPPLARGGGSGRNSVPGYEFPNVEVVTNRLTEMPIRTSALRALGAHLNVFAIESFMDELAPAVGVDPLAFRLDHLEDPRGRRVLLAVAERAQWSGASIEPDCGRGLGYARYKGTGAYCAVVADVEATDMLRVRRLTIAVDVGLAINPDGVENQIEGGAIQATSWTLKERVRFDRSGVTSDSWESYPILNFTEVPAVDVIILPADGQPSLGAGEAAMGPTAAAIGNALAATLGVRVRDLPFTPEAIVAAIEE